MRIASRTLALILIAPAFVACKKTEPTGEAKPAAEKPTEKSAEASAAKTITYTHADPKFTLQLPEGFVPDHVTQNNANMASIRFAKPDEHDEDGKFIEIVWWTGLANQYRNVLSVVEPETGRIEAKDLAGGKGKFFYSSQTASHEVDGATKDGKQLVGVALVDAPGAVFQCQAASFDPAPAPTFIKACATFAAQ